MMKTFDLKKYLFNAVMLIGATPIIVWIIVAIGLCNALVLLFEDPWPLNLLTILLSVSVTAVIYGIVYELIEDVYSSIPHIAKKYFPGYLLLLIRMYLPVLVIASILIMPLSGTGRGYLEIVLISLSMLYIYIIPFFFIAGAQRGAITGGIRFLLDNLGPSTPLIFTVLLLETTTLLFQYVLPLLYERNPLLAAVCAFFIYCVASLIDIVLFIMLVFILKYERDDHGDNTMA